MTGFRNVMMPRWQAVFACLLAIAVWTDFGAYHQHHHGDSIVPVLTSLYHWTFFLWEDDRFGNLLPLLARPIQHPLWNLMLQCGLAILAGLVSFFVLARCLTRESWLPLGAVAALLYFGGYGSVGGGMFVPSHPYGLALALAGAGLVLMLPDRGVAWWRIAAGVALVLAAHWVAVTVALVLVPVLLGRWWYGLGTESPVPVPADVISPAEAGPEPVANSRAGKHRAPFGLSRPIPALVFSPSGGALVVVLAAFSASYGASARSAFHVAGRYAPLPAVQWGENWLGLGRNVVAELPWTLWIVAPLIAVLGVSVGYWRRDRPALRTGIRLGATFATAGILSFLLTGSITWVKLQDHSARYAIPAVFMLELSLLSAGLIPLLAALSERGRRQAAWLSLTALLAVCLIKAEPPSVRGVHENLDRTLGMRTTEILASGATHIVGTYWNVWPSVYHANLTLHEQHSARTVWGVTQRSSPTADVWARMPVSDMRLCAALDDGEAAKWLAIYRFPRMVVSTRLRTIMLIQPAAADPVATGK